ncbi:hypothetical protein BpHYR1_032518 [Brachionus plicatilis]|uniref:Uncharacterized protein n=1 Tax=Brachionus plicatilis TaxID=10195 RepID=A0A3M7Q4A5_BRAPC|nr:hypothetical protein BpHYR1_032518 [Brachionus plicatilis]
MEEYLYPEKDLGKLLCSIKDFKKFHLTRYNKTLKIIRKTLQTPPWSSAAFMKNRQLIKKKGSYISLKNQIKIKSYILSSFEILNPGLLSKNDKIKVLVENQLSQYYQ